MIRNRHVPIGSKQIVSIPSSIQSGGTMGKTFALTATAALLLLSARADHTVSSVPGPPAPTDASRAATSNNGNSALTLHPNRFGPNSYAAFTAHDALPDST